MDADKELIIFEDGTYELAQHMLPAEGQHVTTFSGSEGEVIRVEVNGEPVDGKYVTTLENGDRLTVFEDGEHLYELTKTVGDQEITKTSDGSFLVDREPINIPVDGEPFMLDDGTTSIIRQNGQYIFKYSPIHRRLAEYYPSQGQLASQCILGLCGVLLLAIFYAMFKI